MNPHAKALGKLGKGKSKTLTLAERRRRADRLAAVRLKRWEPKITIRKAGKQEIKP